MVAAWRAAGYCPGDGDFSRWARGGVRFLSHLELFSVRRRGRAGDGIPILIILVIFNLADRLIWYAVAAALRGKHRDGADPPVCGKRTGSIDIKQ